ncbi:LacI family DNA-binding transcriptional regulator [Gracilibacillus phocaeensis]|uniref:LacI family DNA-binding transcriptional regulator n=1 Tax=Gracilibacillus phocaeensis TaxID=2042304 RepID=UPI00102F5D7B|nr:LacI family DNA-binding transcriptional regulator [Gracilibacillus phocaeensis]
MASIEDVAKKAKVSITTVSRSINNHPYVSEKTKKKIAKAMKELNYHPNSIAQQLRGQKTKMIGVIIPYITNPFFAHLVDVIEKKALELGYHLVVLQTQSDESLESFYLELISKKQLDGMILTNLESVSPTVLQLIDDGKIVLCNRYIGDRKLPVIYIDEFQASYEGTQYLINQGHERIAFCTGHILNPNDLRFKGFLAALEEHNLEFNYLDFFDYALGIEGGRNILRKLANKPLNRPTAIFSNGDEIAAGIISEARHFNIEIPKDMAVLGFDDQQLAAITYPEITTIKQPIETMGVYATEYLIAQLEQKQLPDIPKLQTDIIVRDSV